MEAVVCPFVEEIAEVKVEEAGFKFVLDLVAFLSRRTSAIRVLEWYILTSTSDIREAHGVYYAPKDVDTPAAQDEPNHAFGGPFPRMVTSRKSLICIPRGSSTVSFGR